MTSLEFNSRNACVRLPEKKTIMQPTTKSEGVRAERLHGKEKHLPPYSTSLYCAGALNHTLARGFSVGGGVGG